MIREMLSRVLQRCHYVVHVASDADSAIKTLETTCIGTILVDRNMPGRGGDWLVAQVRDRFPGTAVILATGEYVPPDAALQLGIAGFLAKPFSAGTVRDAVSDAMCWHRVSAGRQRK